MQSAYEIHQEPQASEKISQLGVLKKIDLEHDIVQHEKIEEGTFNDVYRGVLKNTQSIVVRVFRKTSSSWEKQKLLQEMQLHGTLFHPNIIELYDYFPENTPVKSILEHANQGDLITLISSFNNLLDFTWECRAAIALDIAVGLAYLHERRILHRDIKPENIFIHLVGASYQAKLGDFGFAVQLPTTKNTINENHIMGTPNYIAPEIWNLPHQFSIKSDVYAYGGIVFTMACLMTPYFEFKNKTFLERASLISRRIRNNELEPIPEETPVQFADFIRLCWTYCSAQRPTITDLQRHGLFSSQTRNASQSDNVQPAEEKSTADLSF